MLLETKPLNPFSLFFLRTIFIIPDVPSGSYFADGLVTISILSTELAGNASKSVFPFPPESELGRPSIKIITVPSPRSITRPSWSTSTEGKRFKISLVVPPRTEISSPTL